MRRQRDREDAVALIALEWGVPLAQVRKLPLRDARAMMRAIEQRAKARSGAGR